MQARMKNPAMILPGAMDGIQSLLKAARSAGVPGETLELVHLRTSQINGCAVCLHGGSHAAKKAGMSDERLWSVAGWREAPFYTDAERAALELAEVLTRSPIDRTRSARSCGSGSTNTSTSRSWPR